MEIKLEKQVSATSSAFFFGVIPAKAGIQPINTVRRDAPRVIFAGFPSLSVRSTCARTRFAGNDRVVAYCGQVFDYTSPPKRNIPGTNIIDEGVEEWQNPYSFQHNIHKWRDADGAFERHPRYYNDEDVLIPYDYEKNTIKRKPIKEMAIK